MNRNYVKAGMEAGCLYVFPRPPDAGRGISSNNHPVDSQQENQSQNEKERF